jgi:hypothetical protein
LIVKEDQTGVSFAGHCAGHFSGWPSAKMPIAPDNFRWQFLPPNRNADASALERS